MKHASFLVLALLTPALLAQRLTVVIDPARGGSEYGARIDGQTYEKQVTLDLADRLRSLLAARDFDVVLTRDSDTVVTNDQRATVANQAKPVACILLHAARSGKGLHLFTSSLQPAAPASTGVLWDEAQAPFVQRSQRLSTELASAFSRSHVAVSNGKTWIRPLDNMQCPAVAIEIAPENDSTTAADRDYQASIAVSIANSMLLWRSHADVVQSIVNPPKEPSPASPQQDAAKPSFPKTPPADAKAASPAVPAAADQPVKPKVRKIAPATDTPPPVPDTNGSTPQ